ncbi:hypothetical protein FHS25_006188 [Rhizobium laguerreae]|jgi:hypothetical protein|uniref:Uncharacterized protein n=1 Tax=Rhizobium laguerreae TaxID=1076926 RepID=A0AAX2QE58_9HYPH|nr:hypothetical protein [Rhizobium laguerreae]TCU18575.1 hypothetical protein EV131_11482 [Rhizobium laguerreae]
MNTFRYMSPYAAEALRTVAQTVQGWFKSAKH